MVTRRRCNNPLLFSQGHGIFSCRVLNFREFFSSNKLPQTVCDAIAAEVPSLEEEEEKEEEEEEEEEEDSGAQPGKLPVMDKGPGLDVTWTAPGSLRAGVVEDISAERQAPPAHIRLTAASDKPRRCNGVCSSCTLILSVLHMSTTYQ